jgi:flagellar hook-basal body complex protein FliE
MNPLDALSAITQAPIPGTSGVAGAAIPLGQTAPVSESFNSLLQPMQSAQATAPTVSSGGSPSTWGHMVQQMVMDVNNQQAGANAMVTDVLKGGPTPVHQAMVATEEASLSFEFLAQMRNKVVDAYNQVMQMQV